MLQAQQSLSSNAARTRVQIRRGLSPDDTELLGPAMPEANTPLNFSIRKVKKSSFLLSWFELSYCHITYTV